MFFTLASATRAAQQNMQEQWVQDFLRSEGKNVSLADGLLKVRRWYFGPVLLPLKKLERICGPEENMQYVDPEPSWSRRVNSLCNAILSGWDMPPLIAEYKQEKFILVDGSHRHEALRRLDKKEAPVIIWMSSKKDYDCILSFYSG